MILFLDTSALVKLYVAEGGSDAVRGEVLVFEHVAISRVAYPEARAALARRCRDGGLTPGELRTTVDALDNDLAAFIVVELSERLSRIAGDLAEKHRLRGFDAIHLASAMELAALAGSKIRFMTFDDRQADAAHSEGLL